MDQSRSTIASNELDIDNTKNISEASEKLLREAVASFQQMLTKSSSPSKVSPLTTGAQYNAHATTPISAVIQHDSSSSQQSTAIIAPSLPNVRVPQARQHRVGPYDRPEPELQNSVAQKKSASSGADENRLITRPHQPSQPRARFFSFLPAHDYFLPTGGPLNFTIAEIVVLLPHWFRNRDIAVRFLHNGITGAAHLAMLEAHRHLNMSHSIDRSRARDHIGDAYRRAMRHIIPGWTKQLHRIPAHWNTDLMVVNAFWPESAHQIGSIATNPVVFRTLAEGLKKLPQGYDAADLTRALIYAIQNKKLNEHGVVTDFMFPDDLQKILQVIGQTQITKEHTDSLVIERYMEVLREEAADKARSELALRNKRSIAEQWRAAEARAAQEAQYSRPFFRPAQPQVPASVNLSTLGGQHRYVPPSGMGMLLAVPLNEPPQAAQQLPLYSKDTSGFRRSFQHQNQEDNAGAEAAAAVAAKIHAEHVAVLAMLEAYTPELPNATALNATSQPTLQLDFIAADTLDSALSEEQDLSAEELDAIIVAHQDYDFSDVLDTSIDSF